MIRQFQLCRIYSDSSLPRKQFVIYDKHDLGFHFLCAYSVLRYRAAYFIARIPDTGYLVYGRITKYCGILQIFFIYITIRVGPYVCMSVQTSICKSICMFVNLQYVSIVTNLLPQYQEFNRLCLCLFV